jgi:hypothetical protein
MLETRIAKLLHAVNSPTAACACSCWLSHAWLRHAEWHLRIHLLPAGLAPAAAATPAATGSGSKATTDTARRILATLDALDKVVAGSPASAKAAAVAAALGEAQPGEGPAASPPPTDSLGFAGGWVGEWEVRAGCFQQLAWFRKGCWLCLVWLLIASLIAAAMTHG